MGREGREEREWGTERGEIGERERERGGIERGERWDRGREKGRERGKDVDKGER